MVIFFFSLLSLTSTTSGSFKEGLSKIAHWTLSAGPLWAESYSYFSLLSKEHAFKTFGHEPVSLVTEQEIRSFLAELNFKDYSSITIKLLKESMREYVLNAVICTDTILFINPDYYSILTTREKKAILSRISYMIESRHLEKNTFALAAIPVATHFLTQAYKKCIDYIVPSYIKHSSVTKNMYDLHTYSTTSWAGKLFVNILASTLYLKFNALKADIKAAEKMGTAHDLLQYYAKIHEKKATDAFLLSIIKEPSSKTRTKTLLTLESTLKLPKPLN